MDNDDVRTIIQLLIEIRDGINRLEDAVKAQTESIGNEAERAELATHSPSCKCGRC